VNGHPARLLLGTGGPGLDLGAAFAKSIGLATQSGGQGVSKTIRATPGTYFPDGDQYGIFPFAVAGTISHEFLKHGAVTFDFAAMKLIYAAT